MVRARLMNGCNKHSSDVRASTPPTDRTSQHPRQNNKTPLLPRQGTQPEGVAAHEQSTGRIAYGQCAPAFARSLLPV